MTHFSKYSLPFNKADLEPIIESIIYDEIFQQPNSTYRKEDLLNQFNTILLKIVPEEKSNKISLYFFEQFTQLRQELENLIYIFYANDPASKSEIEIILAYPGFFAIAIHRLANILFKLDTPILPRFFSEYAHSKTGIDIHPGATIGKNFYIDHGTGIVIGETTIIGDHVKIYQGVTLGAFYVSKNLADKKRHPTIENNVTIYAGATILGGTTVIGENSIIGGNVWITESIEDNSIVYQENKPQIKKQKIEQHHDYII
ncbi:serine O-acetyltransferase [Empedobacter stercoris]|uniref:serine O-acetyltransferase EpsC n=1 Tax=Empedobacter TaxID=59734 RepID=UPI0021AEBD24|nr:MULTISPECIES: serine O-acetyltransferase EpsC [Empedobacter]MDM1523166.1 serine acetyltransferase [Empedobacter sp. 225-1]MDM1543106.1 serine acetyltransferase [Empedobacter sp. 189-2]UWX65944.1 serine O-acetyltransferase [Empedobacter stercoris]